MPFEKTTEKHLNKLKKEIAFVIRGKGMNTSGEAIDSLEVINKNELIGIDYLYFLDKGRKPGKFPPVNNMLDYVRRKFDVPTNEENSVAFLVGRKIKEQGTEIYKDKTKGLELDIRVDKMLDSLANDVAEEAAINVMKWA